MIFIFKSYSKLSLLCAVALLGAVVLAVPDGVYAMGKSSEETPKTADKDFKEGRAAVYAGRYDAAVSLMKKVIAQEPKNADAHNYLGFSYRKTEKLELAAASYMRVFAIEPNHKGALEYQGELFLKLGDITRARKNLVQLEKLCPRGCKELNELRQAIAGFEPSRGS
ncbi:MAG: hypothetical protein CBD27_04610 [Rhodospirillaceae bacterium TMED167]|nr:hypothetical protein [Rhodospirillaceae bacterium]OUW28443.1 MAG: hypothetical protein CBD27_04610 [Rhodospirillaceae bacterium TMED167]